MFRSPRSIIHSPRSILAGPIRPLTALAADPQPRTISERLLLLGWLLPRQALTFGSAGFLLVPDVRAWLRRLQSRLRVALIHQRTVRVTYFSLDVATQAALQDLRRQQTADGGRQSAVGSQRLVVSGQSSVVSGW